MVNRYSTPLSTVSHWGDYMENMITGHFLSSITWIIVCIICSIPLPPLFFAINNLLPEEMNVALPFWMLFFWRFGWDAFRVLEGRKYCCCFCFTIIHLNHLTACVFLFHYPAVCAWSGAEYFTLLRASILCSKYWIKIIGQKVTNWVYVQILIIN